MLYLPLNFLRRYFLLARSRELFLRPKTNSSGEMGITSKWGLENNLLKKSLHFFVIATLLLAFCNSCTPGPAICRKPHLNPECYQGPMPFSRSPFPPFSPEERKEEWAKELIIGEHFAASCDYYRALTAFKRALILMPCDSSRRLQAEYEEILCYYLAEKYADVIDTFNKSHLSSVTMEFCAFRDMLILLFESSLRLNDKMTSCAIRQFIAEKDPKLAEKLGIAEKIIVGDLQEASHMPGAPPYFACLAEEFQKKHKSIQTAQTLSMVLPGAGFWYAGQPNAAITAFILNGLFIAAAYQCFNRGYTAAGVILTSLEIGWYTGGIHGAGQAASDYNQALYQKYAGKAMQQGCMYPLFLMHYTF